MQSKSTTTRLSRAWDLLDSGAVTFIESGRCGDEYRVASQSTEGIAYRVAVKPSGWIYCECPDWGRLYDLTQNLAVKCKHALAVDVLRHLERKERAGRTVAV